MAKSRTNHLFVSMPLTDVQVKTADVVFLLYRGKGARMKKFGELRVSQGAVVWRGKNDKYVRKIGWDRFSKLLEIHGKRSEIRKPREKKSVSRGKRKKA